MSYVTVQAGSEKDLEAQFRAFVLGGEQSSQAATANPLVATTASSATREATRLPSDQVVRQATVNVDTGDVLASTPSTSPSKGGAAVMHFTVQCFLDHVLVFITEDETCAPGVMVRYDPFHNGASHLFYEDEVPSVECTVLFGMRDHPLTNLVASTIAHAIHQYGETRPLLMGISVVQTAKRLAGTSAQRRKEFLELVKAQVMRLAAAP